MSNVVGERDLRRVKLAGGPNHSPAWARVSLRGRIRLPRPANDNPAPGRMWRRLMVAAYLVGGVALVAWAISVL